MLVVSRRVIFTLCRWHVEVHSEVKEGSGLSGGLGSKTLILLLTSYLFDFKIDNFMQHLSDIHRPYVYLTP